MSVKQQYIFLFVAVLVKLSFMLSFKYVENPGSIYDFVLFNEYSGDSPDYIEPVENLLQNGSYYFAEQNYAGRMPGITFIYLPLRVLFQKHIALNLLILIQTILSGLSVFLLAKIAYNKTGKIIAFYLTYILYLLCTYVSIYDGELLTESLATSSLIISLYFFSKSDFDKGVSYKYVFLSGLFFCWCVFLRPYMLPVFGLFWLVFLYQFKMKRFKHFLKLSLIFTLPFIIVDSTWIIRNYKFENKIIPLQRTPYKGYDLQGWFKSENLFIKSFGGDRLGWSPNSHAAWFESDEYLSKYGFSRPDIEIFPEKLFYDDLTRDSLKVAQYYLIRLHKNVYQEYLDEEDKLFYESQVVRILDKFTMRFKSNYPFDYYVTTRAKYFINLIFQPYTYYLPYVYSEVGLFGKLFKIGTYFLNFLIVHLGIIGIIVLMIRRKISYTDFLFFMIALYLILFFPIVRRNEEYRMLTLAFPMFVYSVGIFINFLFSKIEALRAHYHEEPVT